MATTTQTPATETWNTSMMKMYAKVKVAYPSAIVLFRNEHSYTTIGHDAVIVSEKLKLPLTPLEEDKEIKSINFAFDAMDINLATLIRAGFKVALVDRVDR